MSLADRIREAQALLPHDDTGKAPAWTRLEREHDISRGTFSRLLRGDQTSVTNEVAERIARALNVSVGCLLAGEDERSERVVFESGEVRVVVCAERDAAIAFARALKLSDEAIRQVQNLPAYDYSVEEWLALLRVYAANLRMAKRSA